MANPAPSSANKLDAAKVSVDPAVLIAREEKRNAFLQSLGHGDAIVEALPADASFRRYYRVTPQTGKPMLLMEDPPDRPPIPPYVMVEPYKAIDEHLRNLGLHAPEIFAADLKNGLMLIEDFGDNTYTRLFDAGRSAKELYEAAIDVLVHLHTHPDRNALDLQPYDDTMLANEAMLLLDWYVPHVTGKDVTDDMRASFIDMWKGLTSKLPKEQTTLVLRDYHVDNLMIVEGRVGLDAVGLLDFQDGVKGQFSYDVMSLLEDARRDVPKELKEHLYKRYVTGMGSDFDRDAFDYSFKVLAAQRHAKVLGIFVRLCVRDGKERYLQWIPHVQKLFLAAVEDPALKPLKDWMKDNQIEINAPVSKDALKKNLMGPKLKP